MRGLPLDQRIPPPALENSLHIVAIPSNPLDKDLPPLDITAEWMRLKEITHDVPYTISLERTRPPTIEQVRRLVANQRNRVVHFMGHGGQHETGAILCFEKENGELHPVTAREFVMRVRGSVFLVTLNACVSATPGPTIFSNLAAALVRQKTPYALGMRLSIHDDDARTFSRTFYSELASGVSVEEALFQARLTLANSPRSWVIGVPVLYTALTMPAAGFTAIEGAPTIKEHQPQIEVSALPRAEGAFQGRIEELKQLGELLTGDTRPRLVTIHGSGGQGKTALAREAVERFAYAWPGGAWATTLENLPSREVFVSDLARFLGIATQEINDPAEIERQVLSQLNQRRTLIVLDNAETLIDAVEVNDPSAIDLSQFLKQLSGPSVSLLVTSRIQLGWPGETPYEIRGLTPDEGAVLFLQNAPQRADEIEVALAKQLCQKLEGHPFSLCLLGGAFNASAISLQAFIQEWDEQLVMAQNKYVREDHRHRTLYACIDTSVRYLDAELANLLSGLWLFHAPFLPETAATIFDPENEDTKGKRSPIFDRLNALWRRGLLTRETSTLREGTLQFYRLLPVMRPYIEKFLQCIDQREQLLEQFGRAYTNLVRFLFDELNRGSLAAFIAFLLREDLERGAICVMGVEQGYYLVRWGWALYRLGDTRRGLKTTEQALEIAQGQDRELELHTLSNIAVMCRNTGQLLRALELYEQILPIERKLGYREGEASTLSNMGLTYYSMKQPEEALELYQQSLPIMREVGNRDGEAATLNNMALVYHRVKRQLQQALKLYEQNLSILREVGNRDGEAATLYNIALVLRDMHRHTEALRTFEQSVELSHQIVHPAGEAAGLIGMALLLYKHLNRPQEAIAKIEQAIALLVETELPQDAAGSTMNQLRHYLENMHRGVPIGTTSEAFTTMPAAEMEQIVTRTIDVMTVAREYRAEWRKTITDMLQLAKQQGANWEFDIDFFAALLSLLDGQLPNLPSDHPYAPVLAKIQADITVSRPRDGDTLQGYDLPFDPELIPRSIAALSGGPQEKMAHVQYLTAMSAQTTDEGLKALLQVIQLGLFGSDLSQLGQNLSGVYRQAWEAIVIGVETGGVDPRLFEMIVQNTLAVLGPAADQLSEWREALMQIRSQAMEEEAHDLVALLDAVIRLLDGGGNPAGLGTNLKGMYARTWQAIVEHIPSSK